MKQQTRTKQHAVRYKGYTLIQFPWNAYGGKQYAKHLYDPEGKMVLHTGYSKHCSHKELRLMIRDYVDYFCPALTRAAERRKDETTTNSNNPSL